MFVIVFSLLVLHSVIASPIPEEKTVEYREWIPSRVTYARDFDRWFDWVPSSWGGSEGGKRPPPVKERIRILETRQKVLFDLVRCHSYGQTDCTPFRTQAETVFEIPAKEEQSLTPPTKIITPAAPAATAATSAAPAATPATAATPAATAASPAAAESSEAASAASSAAPAESASTEAQPNTTVASPAPITEATTPAADSASDEAQA